MTHLYPVTLNSLSVNNLQVSKMYIVNKLHVNYFMRSNNRFTDIGNGDLR